MDVTDIQARTAANRRLIADLYDTVPEDRLADSSLCTGWSLRTLLGHVVMPLVVSPGGMLREAIRHRSVHRASSTIATPLGARPVCESTGILRKHASHRAPAPGVGPMGQFVDGCVHLQDAALPLGMDVHSPTSDWELVLPWLTTRAASIGHVPGRLLTGLRWVAVDVAWSHGSGPVVRGPAESLALTMTGRTAGLNRLDGPGVEVLRARLDR